MPARRRCSDSCVPTGAGAAEPRDVGVLAAARRRAGRSSAQRLLGLMYDKGHGLPVDHVLAHMWLNLAAAATKGREHEDNVRLREAVASKMSLGQLADARNLASGWVPKRER